MFVRLVFLSGQTGGLPGFSSERGSFSATNLIPARSVEAQAGKRFDAPRRLFQPRRMNTQPLIACGSWTSRPAWLLVLVLGVVLAGTLPGLRAADSPSEPAWRSLPLVTEGKVDTNWVHLGWGGFVAEGGMLRTDCDPKGLGLLVYKKERLGNCQMRVVFKPKEAKSNSGVYVRLADGILEQVNQPGAAFVRDAQGTPTQESMENMQASAEREEGPWFAVHRGYEVQIAGGGDPLHGTGAIYSLADSAGTATQAGEWRTMIITLAGTKITVDLDGKRASTFDSVNPNLPPQKQWHEPKREPKRPEVGYIGLQNHDPGDVVWFKEISVRPLPAARGK